MTGSVRSASPPPNGGRPPPEASGTRRTRGWRSRGRRCPRCRRRPNRAERWPPRPLSRPARSQSAAFGTWRRPRCWQDTGRIEPQPTGSSPWPPAKGYVGEPSPRAPPCPRPSNDRSTSSSAARRPPGRRASGRPSRTPPRTPTSPRSRWGTPTTPCTRWRSPRRRSSRAGGRRTTADDARRRSASSRGSSKRAWRSSRVSRPSTWARRSRNRAATWDSSSARSRTSPGSPTRSRARRSRSRARLDYTVREPLGVTVHIAPWNYPLLLAIRGVAPALAAGNAAVLKPASLTPLTAIAFGRLAKEAGIPDGILNVVVGSGAEVGESLVNDARCRSVSFTGSGDVGRRIAELAARRTIPATLELGGKSPVVVFSDADLDRAARGVAFGIFGNACQMCWAGSASSSIPRSTPRSSSGSRRSRPPPVLGPGAEAESEMGPLVSPDHLQKVDGYVESARSEGGKVVTGGTRVSESPLAQGTSTGPRSSTGRRRTPRRSARRSSVRS